MRRAKKIVGIKDEQCGAGSNPGGNLTLGRGYLGHNISDLFEENLFVTKILNSDQNKSNRIVLE